MRVLGIDPGSQITGYGVVQKERGGLRHVDNGCIRLGAKSALPQRLLHIFESLTTAIRQFSPDVVAVESLFFANNVRSALKLGESRGVALLAAQQCGVAIAEYSPAEIKQAVTGYGLAGKDQIQRMVKALLKLPEVAQADAADALAVAICHCNTFRVVN